MKLKISDMEFGRLFVPVVGMIVESSPGRVVVDGLRCPMISSALQTRAL